MRLFFDTSVLVSVGIAQHPHHPPAYSVFKQVVEGLHQGFVSAHGLAETFNTLTRLPITPMVHPSEAYLFVSKTVVGHCTVVPLAATDYLATLAAAAQAGLRGGINYDALQLHCAEKTECERIYTFNVSDFLCIAPHLGNRIMRP